MAEVLGRITEPKRLFDAKLELGENVIANTGKEKWIVSDLWINNSFTEEREVSLEVSYKDNDDKEVRRKLLNDVELKKNQTMIVGNMILEPNETLVAKSTYSSHAYRDVGDIRFVSKGDGVIGNMISFQFKNPQKLNEELAYDIKNDNEVIFNLTTDDSVDSEKATFTTDLAGSNNNLTFTAKESGTQGNNISVEYIHEGNYTPLSINVDVIDNDLMKNSEVKIKVTLATNSSGSSATNATQVKQIIDTNAGDWVETSLVTAGSGTVTGMKEEYLTGGLDSNITTTYKEIIELIRSKEDLDTLIEVVIYNDYDCEDIVVKAVKTNLEHGEKTIYDSEVYGYTDVNIVGYGRVV